MTIINEQYYITEYNQDGSFKGLRRATQEEVTQHQSRMSKCKSKNYWEADHS